MTALLIERREDGGNRSKLVCNWSAFAYFAQKVSDCNGRRLSYWLKSGDSVPKCYLAVPLDKPLEWATGFFLGNVELSLELWTVIAGISGFDD
jgi:hypothetical protein